MKNYINIMNNNKICLDDNEDKIIIKRNNFITKYVIKNNQIILYNNFSVIGTLPYTKENLEIIKNQIRDVVNYCYLEIFGYDVDLEFDNTYYDLLDDDSSNSYQNVIFKYDNGFLEKKLDQLFYNFEDYENIKGYIPYIRRFIFNNIHKLAVGATGISLIVKTLIDNYPLPKTIPFSTLPSSINKEAFEKIIVITVVSSIVTIIPELITKANYYHYKNDLKKYYTYFNYEEEFNEYFNDENLINNISHLSLRKLNKISNEFKK